MDVVSSYPKRVGGTSHSWSNGDVPLDGITFSRPDCAIMGLHFQQSSQQSPDGVTNSHLGVRILGRKMLAYGI